MKYILRYNVTKEIELNYNPFTNEKASKDINDFWNDLQVKENGIKIKVPFVWDFFYCIFSFYDI